MTTFHAIADFWLMPMYVDPTARAIDAAADAIEPLLPALAELDAEERERLERAAK